MNTSKIWAPAVLALASVAVSSAFADSYDQEFPLVKPGASTLARADIKAELLKAEQDGSMRAFNDNDYPVVVPTGTPKTRAEVRAEVQAASKAGVLDYRGS